MMLQRPLALPYRASRSGVARRTTLARWLGALLRGVPLRLWARSRRRRAHPSSGLLVAPDVIAVSPEVRFDPALLNDERGVEMLMDIFGER